MESPSNHITNVNQTYFWFSNTEGLSPFTTPNTKYQPSALHSGIFIQNIKPHSPKTMQFTVHIETPNLAPQFIATCHPNPFMPTKNKPFNISIEHALKQKLNTFPSHVRLNIISRYGKVLYKFSQKQNNLFSLNQNTTLVASWNGTDSKKRPLPTGVYYYLIVTDNLRQVLGRFLLLR